MQFNPIGWVEIPANDIERAQQFYESLFGFSMKRNDIEGYEMAWFPSDRAAKGIAGAIMKGPGYKPGESGVVIYFTCPLIDETIKKAEEMGGKLIMPRRDLGEYGHMAWISDCEGNVIGLHKRK